MAKEKQVTFEESSTGLLGDGHYRVSYKGSSQPGATHGRTHSAFGQFLATLGLLGSADNGQEWTSKKGIPDWGRDS